MESAGPRRGYAPCRYGQAHFRELGPPAGASDLHPVLVLLHQNPSTSLEYEPLLREMAVDRRVFAFDTPGYGMSDPPPRAARVSDYAFAFSDAIDALGLARTRPVDAFGFHSGALLAAELALQRPDAVGRLALCGVPMRSPEECAVRLAEARNAPQPSDDGAALLAQSAALWAYVVTARHGAVPLERAVALFAEKNHPLHRSAWMYEAVWSYPTRDRLARLVQPTLFLQPQDGLAQQTRDASALVAGAVLAPLPSLDRDIFEVGAARIAAELRAFFAPAPTLETAL